ncbi:MAG TPA: NAD(P)/FAD-dependent oxidoreductase [Actinomycetes bacterium]|nr:NAD(P)/FAD-dependent oxidoreductase [Actinomycetes bacterium]
MGRRPELGATTGASMGTRAAHPGRQAGREGQATGDLPLPPPGLAGGVVDGMLLGVLAWAVVTLTLLPALGKPAEALFPTLLASLFAGGLVGPGLQAALRQRSPARRLAAPAARGRQRVVILGGGFGGVAAARRFEQLLPWTPGLDVTLVSQGNSLLFTPMLAEVAAGSVGAANVSVPLRAACPRTRFRRAEVLGVDLDRQVVQLRSGGGVLEWLPYDHLVLAVGAVPNLRDLPGVAANALTLKTLEDARRLRDHVIGRLEQADQEPDPRERRRWLTFVVAGGGFAGTEAVASVFDLVHSVLRYFPQVRPSEPRFVLVHSRERILPELGRRLADYAHGKLEARGIELRLGVNVAAATADGVLLSDGERLPARTLVWAAGSRPSPLLADLPLARHGGAVLVDPVLRVRATTNLWAVGDCARVPDIERRGAPPCPPTAQHAVRQGKAVADNVVAAMTGRRPQPFRYRALGFLVPLGHQSAAAELRGMRFSGLPAWLLWRGLYLWKLPGPQKRLRVLLDWTVELFFPRDIALTAAERRGTPDRAADHQGAGQPAA